MEPPRSLAGERAYRREIARHSGVGLPPACARRRPDAAAPGRHHRRGEHEGSVRRVAERVLTLRELNRATLARQLLLERKRLSPRAVIERLVGMQAQWPPAPYIGIWTRTTGFRRQVLERELARGAVVKATVMRQTLHLVTPRDYALVRAAMSETNYPWELEPAIRLAPSVRALAEQGPVTTREALVYLEREHGLTGITARRAWRAARARAPPHHHHETAL